MATGRLAFPGESGADVMAAVLRDGPADMDDLGGLGGSGARLPMPLKRLVARCLAKDPDQRYQSAGELALALKSLESGDVRQESAVVTGSPIRPCVAVLPLQNLSPNKAESEYIVDGMTEALIAELAKNRVLRVVSRTSVMQFKNTTTPLRQIARELEADAIIERTVLMCSPTPSHPHLSPPARGRGPSDGVR